MNGRADHTERRFSAPEQRQPNQGRHRHAPGAGTWTPAVPTGPRQHRHTDPPLEATVRGSLPVPPPAGPAHVPAEPPTADLAGIADTAEFTAARGELPITPPSPDDVPTVRRTKVSLTAPAEHPGPAEDDEERVYLAPPDGLSKFDLGSVPASVTPPRTWRKAAWFASLSSGAVVVALLAAGTLLVGQSPDERQVIGWTDRHGGVAPTLDNERYADEQNPTASSANSPSDSATLSRDQDDASESRDDLLSSPAGQLAAPPAGPGEPGRTGGPAGTSGPKPTSRKLEKPPVTPAPTSQAQERYVFPQHDAETMGQRSQDFLNTVTEDPAKAHDMTTGKLADEGADGLRRAYAGIAYFEVKQVYIDQNEGYTINTVEVTYEDGTQQEETRKLVFGDDTKIEDDGQ